MTQAALDKAPQLLKALQWRCIGPPRRGRVVAVAGAPLPPSRLLLRCVRRLPSFCNRKLTSH